VEDTTLKECRGCKQVQAASAFAFRKRGEPQLNTHCRTCTKVKAAAYYLANRERLISHAKSWQAENRDVYLATVKAYQKANRQAYAERNARYSRSNRQKINLHHAQWRSLNRDKIAAKDFRRRANKINAPTVSFSEQQLQARLAYFAWKCWMCGGAYEHIDHVKPLNKGGSHMLANLRPACASCNSSKKDTWLGPSGLEHFLKRSGAVNKQE